MSIGIIAEYNPFHNGHIHQLEYAKKNFPNEKIIVIMSGKYVQRGELAVASFRKRKKMAKKYGADKVIKMPFLVSTQAAHIFAQGAIEIAKQHKIDKILFGSESNDVSNLMKIAIGIKENRDEYNKKLKVFLKQGFSFPKASAEALQEILGQSITASNDILGLEYIKAIVDNDYKIKPYSLKRTVGFHSDKALGTYASATLIRKKIFNNEDISKYTPMTFKKMPKRIEEYYPEFQKIVRSKSSYELSKIKLISEGMENLFKKHIECKTYDEFVNATNSRRYTSSRIKRVMLYVLLEIN